MKISPFAYGSALSAALFVLASCAQPSRAPQALSGAVRPGEGAPTQLSPRATSANVAAQPAASVESSQPSEAVGEHKPDTGISLSIETSVLSPDRIEYTVQAVAQHLVPSATLSVTIESGAVLVGPSSWELTNLAPEHAITRTVIVQRTSAVQTHGAHVIASVRVTRPGESVSEAVGEWLFGTPSRERQNSISSRTAPINAVVQPSAPVGTERIIRTPSGETLHDTVVR